MPHYTLKTHLHMIWLALLKHNFKERIEKCHTASCPSVFYRFCQPATFSIRTCKTAHRGPCVLWLHNKTNLHTDQMKLHFWWALAYPFCLSSQISFGTMSSSLRSRIKIWRCRQLVIGRPREQIRSLLMNSFQSTVGQKSVLYPNQSICIN